MPRVPAIKVKDIEERRCMVCGRIIPEGRFICLACGEYDEQIKAKPKTNADHIRSMSNEMLAEFLCVVQLMESTGNTKSEEEWREYLSSRVKG